LLTSKRLLVIFDKFKKSLQTKDNVSEGACGPRARVWDSWPYSVSARLN